MKKKVAKRTNWRKAYFEMKGQADILVEANHRLRQENHDLAHALHGTREVRDKVMQENATLKEEIRTSGVRRRGIDGQAAVALGLTRAVSVLSEANSVIADTMADLIRGVKGEPSKPIDRVAPGREGQIVDSAF